MSVPPRSVRGLTRRGVLQAGALVSGAVFVSSCTSQTAAKRGSSDPFPPIETAERITDPARFPKEFKESPEFAAQVSSGKLPKVAERIGQDPLVIKPVGETGKYGGEIRRAVIGVSDNLSGVTFAAGPDHLLYYDGRGENVVPNIARGFQMSDDKQVLRLLLRRGMRWSDGAPFTADDILFWTDDIDNNPDLGIHTRELFIGGKRVRVKKIDDYTVEYISASPNPFMADRLAGGADFTLPSAYLSNGTGGYAPRHYLSRFHPRYKSQGSLDREAKSAGFSSWVSYFQDRCKWHTNPELPTLTPWVTTRPLNNPPWELAANPYSIWVDTDGNQLPYIGKITMSNVEDREVVVLNASAGKYDVEDRHLQTSSLSVLLANQKSGDYTIRRAPSNDMDFIIKINLAYDQDKVLGELLRTADFRRALSLGIQRDEVNESFFLGLSKPSAMVPADDSPYFPGKEWRTKWATHDPDQANKLLDGLGLTKRDSGGYRLRPDGRDRIRLDYQSTNGRADFTGMGEMVKRHWSKLGVDVNVQSITSSLLVQRTLANQLMLSGFLGGVQDPFIASLSGLLPLVTNNYPGMIGIPYARWFASGGTKGVEPPPSLKPLKDVMALYQRALSTVDIEARRGIGQDIFKTYADQVFAIGVVGFGLSGVAVHLARNGMGNVPARMLNSNLLFTPLNSMPMTYYHK